MPDELMEDAKAFAEQLMKRYKDGAIQHIKKCLYFYRKKLPGKYWINQTHVLMEAVKGKGKNNIRLADALEINKRISLYTPVQTLLKKYRNWMKKNG